MTAKLLLHLVFYQGPRILSNLPAEWQSPLLIDWAAPGALAPACGLSDAPRQANLLGLLGTRATLGKLTVCSPADPAQRVLLAPTTAYAPELAGQALLALRPALQSYLQNQPWWRDFSAWPRAMAQAAQGNALQVTLLTPFAQADALAPYLGEVDSYGAWWDAHVPLTNLPRTTFQYLQDEGWLAAERWRGWHFHAADASERLNQALQKAPVATVR